MHPVLSKQIFPDFFTGIGYALDYHWDVEQDKKDPFKPTDFEKYGLKNQSVSSGLIFNFLYNNRRNSINPKGGFYANINYRSNLKDLGSHQNYQTITFDFRKYIRFSKRSNNVLALWSYTWLTLDGNPPYLDLPSTGWDANGSTGRGYGQGRFRGKHMIYFEAEYRFGITKNGLLGGVVFANTESFSEWPTNKIKTTKPAIGAGIRIKANKRSDTNLTIDYGFGTGGSRGLFIGICELF